MFWLKVIPANCVWQFLRQEVLDYMILKSKILAPCKFVKLSLIFQNHWSILFSGYGYFTAPEGDDSIVLRLKEDQDGAEPSVNSISSLNLLRLFAYTENKSYQEMSGQLFNSYETTLTRFPVALPSMITGLLMFHKSPLQIIIAGPDKEAKPLIGKSNF